jgi:neutral amino acid transport system permease protein
MDQLSDILVSALRFAIGPESAVFALAAIGLNLHVGYTGLANFGLAGFMLVGAFGLAVGVVHLGMSLWVALLMVLVASTLLSILLGGPTLRLNVMYLSVATLAAGEALRLLFRSDLMQPVTGGVYGLQRFADSFYDLNPIPRNTYAVGPLQWREYELWFMLVAWGLVLLVTGVITLCLKSPWGRVLASIREDEYVARSLGKRVYLRKLQSLVVGGWVVSLAGALLVISRQSADPDTFVPEVTFFVYTALILGGLAKVGGPIIGTITFWFVLTFADGVLRTFSDSGNAAHVLSDTQVGATRFMLAGLGLMLLVVFRPDGMLAGLRLRRTPRKQAA